MRKRANIKELVKALKELEIAIGFLIHARDENSLDEYYYSYAKVANMKITHGDEALLYNHELHWLYEPINTENYR